MFSFYFYSSWDRKKKLETIDETEFKEQEEGETNREIEETRAQEKENLE